MGPEGVVDTGQMDDWEMLAGDVSLRRLWTETLPAGGAEIHVEVETALGARSLLVLPDARRMWLEQQGEVDTGMLRIEAGDRAMIVRFDEPVFPGIPDGLP